MVYFYSKNFLLLLLYFWNYNPSPNGQIDWRSNTPLNTTPEGWMVQRIEYSQLKNISNYINWRRMQISILYIKFPAFFHWKSIYKNVYKGPHKRTRDHWSSRSSRTKVLCKKGVIRNFVKFTGHHLRHSLFLLIKLQALSL